MGADDGVSAADTDRQASASRIVVSAFGAVVAFAGLEHGVGELLQGPVTPTSWAIESWPNAAAFEILAGEPAMTIVPNLLVAGVLTIVVSLLFGAWAVSFVHRSGGGLVLIGLSVALLLVGGGFSPPIIGVVLGVAATRIGAPSTRQPGPILSAFAPLWPWALGIGIAAYLGLFPGLVLLSGVTRVADAAVYGLAGTALLAMLLALVAARGADRRRSS
ncbi:MAG TPA: hypothetical protein VF071_11365 [Candidatus Limnocylindria bacterium]